MDAEPSQQKAYHRAAKVILEPEETRGGKWAEVKARRTGKDGKPDQELGTEKEVMEAKIPLTVVAESIAHALERGEDELMITIGEVRFAVFQLDVIPEKELAHTDRKERVINMMRMLELLDPEGLAVIQATELNSDQTATEEGYTISERWVDDHGKSCFELKIKVCDLITALKNATTAEEDENAIVIQMEDSTEFIIDTFDQEASMANTWQRGQEWIEQEMSGRKLPLVELTQTIFGGDESAYEYQCDDDGERWQYWFTLDGKECWICCTRDRREITIEIAIPDPSTGEKASNRAFGLKKDLGYQEIDKDVKGNTVIFKKEPINIDDFYTLTDELLQVHLYIFEPFSGIEDFHVHRIQRRQKKHMVLECAQEILAGISPEEKKLGIPDTAKKNLQEIIESLDETPEGEAFLEKLKRHAVLSTATDMKNRLEVSESEKYRFAFLRAIRIFAE